MIRKSIPATLMVISTPTRKPVVNKTCSDPINSWPELFDRLDQFEIECQPYENEKLVQTGSINFENNVKTGTAIEARVSQIIRGDRTYTTKVLFYIQGKRVSKDHVVRLLA